MDEFRTVGIVTHATDFREYDKMITILTPDRGKVDLCLKGCRKPKAKLRPAGQLFCFGEFELTEHRPGHYIMVGCSVKDSFFDLALDLEKLEAAGKLCRIMNAFFDGQPEDRSDLFSLFISALSTLAYTPRVRPKEILLLTVIRTLSMAGYKPMMDLCVECGNPVGQGSVAFHPELGGVLCEHCMQQQQDWVKISAGAASTLRMCEQIPNEKLATFHFSDLIREELTKVMTRFLEERLEQHIIL